jgi:hypothetical protein
MQPSSNDYPQWEQQTGGTPLYGNIQLSHAASWSQK